MRRSIIIVLLLAVALPATFLLFMRYGVVASEGYPTWSAVRNILMRDGEIVIELPNNVKILDAQCDHAGAKISVDGQVVTTKIGYSWCIIVLDVEIQGKEHTLRFNPQKMNNWNRIRFEPVNPSDPFSEFIKFENGIEKPNSDTSRATTPITGINSDQKKSVSSVPNQNESIRQEKSVLKNLPNRRTCVPLVFKAGAHHS